MWRREYLKMIIEEYGKIIVSSSVGVIIIGLGIGMFDTMKPVFEIYVSVLM